MAQAGRNNFTPAGKYPKIQLPWSNLKLPYLDPTTGGQVDQRKLTKTLRAIQERIDEQSSYLNRTTFGEGEGTRWATVVIAASDSTPANKLAADFICTGAGDQVVINQVIASLEASRGSTRGIGRIVLLEGTYTLSGQIVINNLGARQLVIQGMGGGNGHAGTIPATRVISSTMAFEIGGNTASAGSAVVLMDMGISGAGADPTIKCRDAALTVRDCSVVSASGVGGAIVQSNSTGAGAGTRIVNNIVKSVAGGSPGIWVDVGSGVDEPTFVCGNRVQVAGSATGIRGANNSSTVPTYVITANHVTGSTTGGTGEGITIAGNSQENSVVADNVVKNIATGILVAGYRSIVSGNVVDTTGVAIRTSSDSQQLAILGNTISNATTGYLLTNNAVHPTVIGNKSSATTTSFVVAAGVTDAFIRYNDFDTPGTDAGTGTTVDALLPPGGATDDALRKVSGADFDVDWAPVHETPTGGSTGDVLTKDSGTAFDYSWQPSAAGTSLSGLSDVDLTGLADGDGIFYDAGSGLWLPGVGGGGGGGGGTILYAKPTDNATSVSTTTMVGFNTPWRITGVVVGSIESVMLSVSAAFFLSADSISWLGITRGGTIIARSGINYTASGGTRTNSASFDWVDVTPGAATYTYEVIAGLSGGGTLTIQCAAPNLTFPGSPFHSNSTSIFTARVFS